MTWFRQTSALRLQLPTPPDGPDSEDPPIGNDAPYVCGLLQEPRRPCSLHHHVRWRGKPSTTTSKRRLSVARTGRSKSRIMQFVPTRSPASRQMRTATLSSANPPDRGNGNRKRRKRTTRKRWRGICVKKPVGTIQNAAPAPGPAWDRIIALSLGKQTFEEDLVSELLFDSGSSFVLPPLPKPAWFQNSSGSRIAGRAPVARASHEGAFRNTLQLRNKMVATFAVSGMDHRECVRPTGQES